MTKRQQPKYVLGLCFCGCGEEAWPVAVSEADLSPGSVIESNADLTRCFRKALDNRNSIADAKMMSSGFMMFLIGCVRVCVKLP